MVIKKTGVGKIEKIGEVKDLIKKVKAKRKNKKKDDTENKGDENERKDNTGS